MNKLYFINSESERKFVGECRDRQQAIDMIYHYCRERDFEVYYMRYWENTESNSMRFDVGSHTEFFEMEIGS